MSSFEKLVQQMDREDEDDYEDKEERILDATFAMEDSAMSRKTGHFPYKFYSHENVQGIWQKRNEFLGCGLPKALH